MTFANIVPTPGTDGIPYCTAVPLVSLEADLGDNIKTPAPIAVEQGQVIIAIIKVWINGHITANNAYVFLQTDLGDGVWVDIAWIRFTGTDQNQNQPAVFVLCGGGNGAENNAFGPQRQQSSAPSVQANGSNLVPLGGRARFTGFGNSSGGSSSLAGTYAGVYVTITYKLVYPR